MTLRTFTVTRLAAVLAVLTLASSASADCAWVLWIDEVIVGPVPGGGIGSIHDTSIVRGFPGVPACESAAAAAAARYAAIMGVSVSQTSRGPAVE
jgi:hypothetical protein